MKNFSIALLLGLCVSGSLGGMDGEVKPLSTSGGPMNAEWVCRPDNPFKKANIEYQNRQWQAAEYEYKLALPVVRTDKYNCNMAKVNLAYCMMMQGMPSKYWRNCDPLFGVDKAKRLPKNLFKDSIQLQKKIVLVRTDKTKDEDIFHFIEAAHVLQKRTGCYVMLLVRNTLKDTLLGIATAYDFGLVVEKEGLLLSCDYETHIVSLLGHLLLSPAQKEPLMHHLIQ